MRGERKEGDVKIETCGALAAARGDGHLRAPSPRVSGVKAGAEAEVTLVQAAQAEESAAGGRVSIPPRALGEGAPEARDRIQFRAGKLLLFLCGGSFAACLHLQVVDRVLSVSSFPLRNPLSLVKPRFVSNVLRYSFIVRASLSTFTPTDHFLQSPEHIKTVLVEKLG